MAELPEIDRKLTTLEAEIKRLESEYTLYFSGRLPKPPWETRKRVESLVRQIDRSHISNYALRFRFSTLQSRFVRSADLWDRALRAREEGRPGPFSAPRSRQAAAPSDLSPAPRGTTFSDPQNEMDKLHELYDRLTSARRQVGQAAVPFHKFADLIRTQVSALKEKGSAEVAFQVAIKDGRVALTAKGIKGTRGKG